MAVGPSFSLHALTRSGLVLAGLLLLAVGFGNLVVGRTKIVQYEEVLRVAAPARAVADPGVLFPPTNDSDERHELALAKLAFYHLLVTAGQLLSAVGALLLSLGVLRQWMRAPAVSARMN